MLRSELIKGEFAAYSIVWSPDFSQVAFGLDKQVVIKSLRPGVSDFLVKATTFGNILSIDWSITENLIVASGEDCRFVVIDNNG